MFDITDLKLLVKNTKEFITNDNQEGLNFITHEINNFYDKKKYYEFWGLNQKSTPDEIENHIKQHIRSLSFAFHPDKYQNENHKKWAGDIIAKINKMAETIRNPELKQQFDEELNSIPHYTVEKTSYTWEELLNDDILFSTKKDKSNINSSNAFNINDYLKQEQNATENMLDKLNVSLTIDVPLENYLSQDTFDINLNLSQNTESMEKCLSCSGASMFTIEDNKENNCKVCGGTGFIYHKRNNNNINKKVTLSSNEQYTQNCKIQLDGYGLEKNGIKGNALITFNFITPNHISFIGNTITINVQPTIIDYLQEYKEVKLFDYLFQIPQKQLKPNNIIQIPEKIKGKNIILSIQNPTINDKEIHILQSLNVEQKQNIATLFNHS